MNNNDPGYSSNIAATTQCRQVGNDNINNIGYQCHLVGSNCVGRCI